MFAEGDVDHPRVEALATINVASEFLRGRFCFGLGGGDGIINHLSDALLDRLDLLGRAARLRMKKNVDTSEKWGVTQGKMG